MPHRKNKMPEKLYVPGTRDENGDVGDYDKYIDELDGYAPEDFEDEDDIEDEPEYDEYETDIDLDTSAIDDEEELDEGYFDEEVDASELLARHRAADDMIEEDNNPEDLFTDFVYNGTIPKIPEQYRASDIIGKRTQASSGSNAIPIGAIRPKDKLRDIWNGMTDVEKYIMMLISEHRHLTLNQLSTLVVTPSRLRMRAGAVNNTKTYYEWVTKQKYGVEGMNYKNTFKMQKIEGLTQKIRNMCRDGLLEEIIPAYAVNEKNISERYIETPSLFTHHYYLTPLGARVLICNTKANKPGSKVNPVGYVPTYKNAAYQTVLHEAESTEVLCSIISCASYVSNPDDGNDYGLLDVCRFYHEKDVEEKGVTYKGKKINFKTDGKLTMYVNAVDDFIDWYIEYDSGSSTKDKITHKTEAFIKYIFWKRQIYGDKFRKPVLLLITQKPADLFPQINGRKRTTYTTGIKNMAKQYFEEYLDIINDIAVILVADCGSIRVHGALGACWHKIDLTTGIPSMRAYDLISASMGNYDVGDAE